MTQPNNVGDYNTDYDYGTVDGTHTQSPFATSGPHEVIFIFILIYFLKPVLGVLGNVNQEDFTQGSIWYEKTKTQPFEWIDVSFDSLRFTCVAELMDRGGSFKATTHLLHCIHHVDSGHALTIFTSRPFCS